MTKPRYCRDCRWYVRDGWPDHKIVGSDGCERPLLTAGEIEVSLSAKMERYLVNIDGHPETRRSHSLLCGPQGQYWEAMPVRRAKRRKAKRRKASGASLHGA